eukprot:gene25586-34150_t
MGLLLFPLFPFALIIMNASFTYSIVPSISPREIVTSTPLSCSSGTNPCTGKSYPTCCSTNGVVFCAPSGSTCCTSTATYCSSSYPVCCQNNSSSANSYCLSSGSTCCGNGYYCPKDTTCTSTSSGTKSPSYSCTTSSSGCFAGFETVTMDSGEKKVIQDVQVGDRILAYSTTKKGNLPVFMEIWMDGYDSGEQSSLTLTPDHLIQVVVGECIATVSGQKRVIGSGYPTSLDRYNRSGYSVVAEDELIVVSDVIVSPFSANHFLPNLFYYIHRYLYRYHREVWLSLSHSSSGSGGSSSSVYIHSTPYEEGGMLEQMTATLSYLADIAKPYLA